MKKSIKKHGKEFALIAVVVVFAGFISWVKVVDLPSVCGSCHVMEPYLKTWEASSHSREGVACTDCHISSGLLNHALAHTLSHVIAVVNWNKKPFLKDESGFHDNVAGFDINEMSFEGKSEVEEKELVRKCRRCHPNRPAKSYFLYVFKRNKPTIDNNCRGCHPEITKLSRQTQKKDSNIHSVHLKQHIHCLGCHARMIHSVHPENPLPGKDVCRKCHPREKSFS